jgi:hypothetical protein
MADDKIPPALRHLSGIETIPIPPEEEQRLREAGRNITGALKVIQRPTGPAKAHEFIVGQLVAQGAQTSRFLEALERTFPFEDDPADEPDDDTPLPGLPEFDYFECVRGIRPDAYTITPDEVCIYEVEVTSPISAEKLDRYAELWGILDNDHSAFCRLFAINARGDMQEIDLPELHFRDPPEEPDG